MLNIEINNQQNRLPIDGDRLTRAVEMILVDAGVEAAAVNVAVVDDPTIHDLNRRFLDHDEPTDVLSFMLDDEAGRLEGDVIASADTAVRTAVQLQWPASDELLLYVIHGSLHLVGYDDLDPESCHEMRDRERHYLAQFGLQSPSTDPENDLVATSPRGTTELLVAHEG
ncbi:MAG TPA: rRNA maturation RNase YbeY [Pirellulales bacterium]